MNRPGTERLGGNLKQFLTHHLQLVFVQMFCKKSSKQAVIKLSMLDEQKKSKWDMKGNWYHEMLKKFLVTKFFRLFAEQISKAKIILYYKL